MKFFVFWFLGFIMGDYMRLKIVFGNEGGLILFILRWNKIFFLF